ncbi:hypothetical protein [Chryseolinea soli]|nr:hypothetical protein [Chryseolinea soli]
MRTFLRIGPSLMILSLFVLQGCTKPESLEPAKYLPWIAAEDNGLVRTKAVNHVTMRARFLPADYLAYREFMNSDNVSFDTVRKSYACGLSFQVSLQADKSDKVYGNLIQYGLQGDRDFLNRSTVLSFDIQNFISLKYKSKTILPVLSQYEGYNAIANSLSFQVVFQLQDYGCGDVTKDFDDVTLVFEDPYWNLGVNQFLFQKNSLTSIPKLKF